MVLIWYTVSKFVLVCAGADDDVDSVSPRTLRQAADRLAKFTSDRLTGVRYLSAGIDSLSSAAHVCCASLAVAHVLVQVIHSVVLHYTPAAIVKTHRCQQAPASSR